MPSGTPTEIRRGRQVSRGRPHHVRTSGAKINTPIVSPIHHVNQLNGTPSGGKSPATVSAATPNDELARQATGPPHTRKRTTSLSRTSVLGDPSAFRIKARPTSAWSVAPHAIAPVTTIAIVTSAVRKTVAMLVR